MRNPESDSHGQPRPAHRLLLLLVLSLLIACSDGTDTIDPEARALLRQFGPAASLFSEAGLRALLDMQDRSSAVTLIQIVEVADTDAFARYEAEIATVWDAVGGSGKFASRVFAQFLGERPMSEVRAIEFPNVMVLIDAINSLEFKRAMTTLSSAAGDQAWVLGIEQLHLDLQGGFVNPELQGLGRAAAIDYLASVGDAAGSSGELEGNREAIVDMLVSDSPEPFYMVNLIDFREQATYPDGRASDLTGREANEIYGAAIAPQLLLRNSGPFILFPISVVLTREAAQWEQAVIVRYASRDAFLTIFPLNPNAADALIHKEAGIENTQVWASDRVYDSPPEPVAGALYLHTYCDVIQNRFSKGGGASIFTTLFFRECPIDAFSMIDLEQLGLTVDYPVTDGPRLLTVDWTPGFERVVDARKIEAEGITFNYLFSSPNVFPSYLEPYDPEAIDDRTHSWHYVAGRRIYQLQDPDGRKYLMHSMSRQVDPTLGEADLATLGDRLELPPGWTFSTRVLTNAYELKVVGDRTLLVGDELGNQYQLIE